MEKYYKVAKWIENNKLECVKSYILYIDILGYKNNIKTEEDFFDNCRYILEVIIKERLDQYRMNKKDCKKNVQYKVFSDNIIIAIPDDENENELAALCDIASRVQSMVLFHFGYLLRGSISIGQLYIGDTFVYGEGLIKAYELENNNAIYPRIILDHDSLKDEVYYNNSNNKIIKIDGDYKIINFLHFYFKENLVRVNGEGRIKQLKRMREYISNYIINKDEKIRQKGLYSMHFFNSIIDKYEIGEYIDKIIY